MKIAIIGLGLIGGSFCKALKKNTDCIVLGLDNNHETIEKALRENSIDQEISVNELNDADITFVALHPTLAFDFISENADNWKENSIVSDLCGVKGYFKPLGGLLAQKNVQYLGCHPMAGREFSGYDYSTDSLFENASFIITKADKTTESSITLVTEIARKIGFSKIVVTTPEVHDKNIAFTSQLAHVVSNTYIKSPTAHAKDGFSAGSYLDLTRVAKLNADMWTELFIANQKPLSYELDIIIKNLIEFKETLDNTDTEKIRQLLEKGSQIKSGHSPL